mmetsp:Transcript_11457/g.35377  ORF Transcript_11457/g.35377 Transcript_11457/m.35377 type:complete len:402 (+) Transcript_11457:1070-2275(+)
MSPSFAGGTWISGPSGSKAPSISLMCSSVCTRTSSSCVASRLRTRAQRCTMPCLCSRAKMAVSLSGFSGCSGGALCSSIMSSYTSPTLASPSRGAYAARPSGGASRLAAGRATLGGVSGLPVRRVPCAICSMRHPPGDKLRPASSCLIAASSRCGTSTCPKADALAPLPSRLGLRDRRALVKVGLSASAAASPFVPPPAALCDAGCPPLKTCDASRPICATAARTRSGVTPGGRRTGTKTSDALMTGAIPARPTRGSSTSGSKPLIPDLIMASPSVMLGLSWAIALSFCCICSTAKLACAAISAPRGDWRRCSGCAVRYDGRASAGCCAPNADVAARAAGWPATAASTDAAASSSVGAGARVAFAGSARPAGWPSVSICMATPSSLTRTSRESRLLSVRTI